MGTATPPSAPRCSPVERIAILRALPGVGDLLCAVPALRAVRSAHPAARVTLVGLASARWFIDRYPELVDDLLVAAGVAGLPEVEPDPSAALALFGSAQVRRFDLALQLHGSGLTTNPLITMLGARHQVTAHLAGQWRPPGASIAYPDSVPEVDRLLAVAEAAGCPSVGLEIDLPFTDSEREAARGLVRRTGPSAGRYVCLHPGASRPENRWPHDRFATLGDRLAAAGMGVVLTGTAAERTVVDAVARGMAAPAVDLCGRTDIGTLAALFAGARVVISNDTGAAHVAAAVGALSVVVYPSGADVERWAPADAQRHVRVTTTAHATDPWPAVDDVLAGAVRHIVAEPGARAPGVAS